MVGMVVDVAKWIVGVALVCGGGFAMLVSLLGMLAGAGGHPVDGGLVI
jgi:hypothetical protein